jgi:hypothetical protein
MNAAAVVLIRSLLGVANSQPPAKVLLSLPSKIFIVQRTQTLRARTENG